MNTKDILKLERILVQRDVLLNMVKTAYREGWTDKHNFDMDTSYADTVKQYEKDWRISSTHRELSKLRKELQLGFESD